MGSKTPETRLVIHTTPKALLFNALKNNLHLDESISSSLNESGLKLGGSSSGSLSSSHSVTDSSKLILRAVCPTIEESEEDCTEFDSDQSKVMRQSSSHQAESQIVVNALNPQHDAVDKKIVELERWTIQLLPNKKLCLEGHQKGDGGETFHRSGPVSKRLDSDLIQTVSGQLYQLSGRFRRQSFRETGLLKKVLYHFHNGFPDNWEELLHNALSENPSSNSSSKDRKTRKKTRPTNGSSSPVLADVKESRDSSKNIHDSEPSKNIPDSEPRRRSTRFRVQPLAYWATQRLVVDPVTMEAKISQEIGNVLSFLPMKDKQKQGLHSKQDSSVDKKKSKEGATEPKITDPGNCSEMLAPGSSKVVHSSVRECLGMNSRKIVKNKKPSRSIYSKGLMTGGLDNSVSRSAGMPSSTVTRSAGKADLRFAGKASGIEKTVSGKFDFVSNVGESANSGRERRTVGDHRAKAGRSYRRSVSSLDGANDDESDGVSKKIQSKRIRSRLFDSDFTSDDDDVVPASKRTKKPTKNKQNPKVSRTEEKRRVDSKRLRRHSQGRCKGSTNSSLKTCKVVLENCTPEHLDDQASFRGQSSHSNSSRGGTQQSCHNQLPFCSPKHTGSNTKCGQFDQEGRSRKKGNIKYLRQEGTVEFIYSKPSPSGKILVQTRDSEWHEEDPFSFFNEDPAMKSLPQRPVPPKEFISVNLSEADDSDDVDYVFSSDEG